MQDLNGRASHDTVVAYAPGDRLYAAFLTVFMVGLRRGELLGYAGKISICTLGVLHVGKSWCVSIIVMPPGKEEKHVCTFKNRKPKNPAVQSLSRTYALPPSSAIKRIRLKKNSCWGKGTKTRG